MKGLFLIGIAAAMLILVAGCDEDSYKADQEQARAAAAKRSEAPAAEGSAAPAANLPPGAHAGTVMETMDSGGYTYVLIDEGDKEVWAAGPKTEVAVGDEVATPPGGEMRNYHSSTLNRTFEQIYFVTSIETPGHDHDHGPAGSEDGMPPGHPSIQGDGSSAGSAKASIDISGIAKPEGGYRISEIYEDRVKLSAKEVVVRGQVVKFTADIMGTNWVHLMDGTGGEGSNDLTITTSATTKAGDTILVRGKLSADKDFGYGYKYEVIIEECEITIE